MPGPVPDSSMRTAQVAANAFTRVKVGLDTNGPKPHDVFASLRFKSGRFIGLRPGGGGGGGGGGGIPAGGGIPQQPPPH